MDTSANLIDKLLTVNLKIYHNAKNKDSERLTNLMHQQRRLCKEIDDMITKVLGGMVADGDIIRPQHKTY